MAQGQSRQLKYSRKNSDLELAVDCVVLKKVAKGFDVDEGIIDSCDLNVGMVQRRSQNEPTDTPKAIDTKLDPANV